MKRSDFSQFMIAGAFGLLNSGQTKVSTSLIDCHSHIWPKFGEHPFRTGIQAKDLKPASFTAEDLIAAGKPFGIDKFCLIQHIYYHGYDSSYFKMVSAQYPGKFAIVGAIDKNDPTIEEKMKLDEGSDVSGYRIPSKDRESWLLGSKMDRYWSLAAEYKQSICLLRNRNVSLQSVYKKCKLNPKTKVVIDHYAHVDFNDREEVNVLWQLSEMDNVYLKVSKYYGNGQMTPPYFDMLPVFKQVLEKFGSEKLMWGSDCPYQLEGQHSYQAAFEVLDKYADFMSPLDRQNIFQNTAEKVFFKS